MFRNKRQRPLRQRIDRVAKGTLPHEEIQHLKRLGAAVPKPKERILRRFAAWWDTTPVEKTLEDIEHILSNSAFLNIVQLAASITILLSLASWWTGRRARLENELFATWTVVNEGVGDQSGVARIAVERMARNGFTLAGLELSGVNLEDANLQGTNLEESNLQGADLEDANLQGANLEDANLQEADLENANLQGADLYEANLTGVEGLTEEQLAQAKLCRTILPEGISLDPNRSCAQARNLEIQVKSHLQDQLDVNTKP